MVVLAATIAMFIWGKWRHDVIALGALLASVLAGLVPAPDAFLGFGHAAVITVVSVLILGSGLQSSGVVDALARVALPKTNSTWVSVAALTSLAVLLSATMNDVGTLALLMPVAIQTAARQKLPPGKILMPLAFASILGGMTTLIGTPSNLVVSSFRDAQGLGGYGVFDFTPVGLAVAAGGVIFVVLFSRWLVPARKRGGMEDFDIGTYLTEARIRADSKAVGLSLREIDKLLEGVDAQVIGLIRDEVRIPVPNLLQKVQAGDILAIEAGHGGLATALSALHLKLEEDVRAPEKTGAVGSVRPHEADAEHGPNENDEEAAGKSTPLAKPVGSDEVLLAEFVVLPRSQFVRRSASGIRLRTRYSVNLLAILRQGRRSVARLRDTPIEVGDVLLLQGTADNLSDFTAQYGCAPLAERPFHIPNARVAITAAIIMACAVGGAALGLVPTAVSFAAGVFAMLAFGVLSPRHVYDAVDWPVVVMLGALLPVAGALGTSGTANLLARLILAKIPPGHAAVVVALLLILTAMLTNFMNNTATAAVMSPIAIHLASDLGASADPFLMAVAVGASCAFLTPINQNNALILGPGGFRFGDYWRLGLPLQIIVLAMAVPLILLVWPL